MCFSFIYIALLPVILFYSSIVIVLQAHQISTSKLEGLSHTLECKKRGGGVSVGVSSTVAADGRQSESHLNVDCCRQCYAGLLTG